MVGRLTIDVPSPSASERCTSIVHDSPVTSFAKLVQQIRTTWNLSQLIRLFVQLGKSSVTKASSHDQDIHVQTISIRPFFVATMGELGQLRFEGTPCWDRWLCHC